MTKLFGVVGSPILHSKSPQIFSQLFKDETHNYIRFHAENSDDVSFIFEELDIAGMNITAPLKTQLKFVDEKKYPELNPINTIVREKSKVVGYNTDFIGVLDSFKQKGINLSDKKIAILGAGGAAEAVVFGISQFTKNITIFNRTLIKSQKTFPQFEHKNLSELDISINSFDVLISTIPQNIQFNFEKIDSKLCIFDANYKNSQWEKIASKFGCTFISGKSWLLNQAYPAYEMFTKNKPSEISFPEQQKNNQIISLIGFMGSGKTTVGKLLADKLSLKFVDIDQEIERLMGKKISTLFENYGEKFFRELETQVLSIMFLSNKRVVVSTGGGIIEREQNRKMLQKSTNIWLYSSIDKIHERINADNRPNFKNPKELFAKRKNKYAEVADLFILNQFTNAEETAQKIYEEITSCQS